MIYLIHKKDYHQTFQNNTTQKEKKSSIIKTQGKKTKQTCFSYLSFYLATQGTSSLGTLHSRMAPYTARPLQLDFPLSAGCVKLPQVDSGSCARPRLARHSLMLYATYPRLH